MAFMELSSQLNRYCMPPVCAHYNATSGCACCACSEENQGMMEASALELLSSLLEESDDVSQQLLDAILVNLLPQKEQGAAYRCGHNWVVGNGARRCS